MAIRVVVHGATGRMGQEIILAITEVGKHIGLVRGVDALPGL